MKRFKLFPLLSVIFVFILLCMGVTAFADETNVFDYYKNEDGTVTITGYKANDINIVIPGMVDTYKVTAIDDNAFSGMSKIETVTIPDGVTSIGNAAFYGCSSLSKVEIPDTVIFIGEYAFGKCPLLDDLKIPDNAEAAENIFWQREGKVESQPTNGNSYDPSGFIMIVLVLVFAVAACIACVWMFIKAKKDKKAD